MFSSFAQKTSYLSSIRTVVSFHDIYWFGLSFSLSLPYIVLSTYVSYLEIFIGKKYRPMQHGLTKASIGPIRIIWMSF